MLGVDAGDAGLSGLPLGTVAVGTVPLMMLGAGLIRTRHGVVLAAVGALAQLLGIAATKIEQSSIPLDSLLMLRSGIVGTALLAGAAIVAAGAYLRHDIDTVADIVDDDEPEWRWSPTE